MIHIKIVRVPYVFILSATKGLWIMLVRLVDLPSNLTAPLNPRFPSRGKIATAIRLTAMGKGGDFASQSRGLRLTARSVTKERNLLTLELDPDDGLIDGNTTYTVVMSIPRVDLAADQFVPLFILSGLTRAEKIRAALGLNTSVPVPGGAREGLDGTMAPIVAALEFDKREGRYALKPNDRPVGNNQNTGTHSIQKLGVDLAILGADDRTAAAAYKNSMAAMAWLRENSGEVARLSLRLMDYERLQDYIRRDLGAAFPPGDPHVKEGPHWFPASDEADKPRKEGRRALRVPLVKPVLRALAPAFLAGGLDGARSVLRAKRGALVRHIATLRMVGNKVYRMENADLWGPIAAIVGVPDPENDWQAGEAGANV